MAAAQILVMPANDATVKYLVASLPAVQLTWARFFGNLVLLAPFVLARHGPAALRVSDPRLQLLRGLVIVAANLTFIAAVGTVPLADAIALIFVAPLVVTALSHLLLGEPVGPWRWAAVLIGFAGALVIIRPGMNEFGWTALLPLAAALCYALYLLITRRLVGTAPALVTQTITAAVGAAIASLLVPFVWQAPTAGETALMVFIGTASCVGHLLITVAHDHAEASTLAPLTYLSIVGATLFGWLIFGDLPDALTLAGAAIVIGSGLFIGLHARRRLSDEPDD